MKRSSCFNSLFIIPIIFHLTLTGIKREVTGPGGKVTEVMWERDRNQQQFFIHQIHYPKTHNFLVYPFWSFIVFHILTGTFSVLVGYFPVTWFICCGLFCFHSSLLCSNTSEWKECVIWTKKKEWRQHQPPNTFIPGDSGSCCCFV